MTDLELPNPKELAEIKTQTFTRWVALSTALFAVILAISYLGGTSPCERNNPGPIPSYFWGGSSRPPFWGPLWA